MARPREETIVHYITSTVLPHGGKHKHLAEVCCLAYKHMLMSRLVDGTFVLYKSVEGDWIPYAHVDLALNELRTTLASYIDKARYNLQSPKMADAEYGPKLRKWQDSILQLLTIHEQLYDYTYMKCIMQEVLLSVYLING